MVEWWSGGVVEWCERGERRPPPGGGRIAACFWPRAVFWGDLQPIVEQYDHVRDVDMESPLASAKLSDELAN